MTEPEGAYKLKTIINGSQLSISPPKQTQHTEMSLARMKPKKEINVSTDAKSTWKLKIFCDYTNDSKGKINFIKKIN